MIRYAALLCGLASPLAAQTLETEAAALNVLDTYYTDIPGLTDPQRYDMAVCLLSYLQPHHIERVAQARDMFDAEVAVYGSGMDIFTCAMEQFR